MKKNESPNDLKYPNIFSNWKVSRYILRMMGFIIYDDEEVLWFSDINVIGSFHHIGRLIYPKKYDIEIHVYGFLTMNGPAAILIKGFFDEKKWKEK